MEHQLNRGDTGRYLRAARVDRAVEGLAGPFGLRRFVLLFELHGTRVRLTHVEAVGLSWGGGPPPPDPQGDRVAALENAVNALHRNMSTGPARWSRCAIGYVRDVDGRSQILPAFDDDVDNATLDRLPMPGPPGHPLEAPQTLDLLGRWEAGIDEVLGRTRSIAPDWDEWEINDDRELLLYYGDAPRRLRCRVLGVFWPKRSRFTWHGGPVDVEAVFQQKSFSASWDAAAEVAMLATARLGADWLFAQSLEDSDRLLLAAVWGR